MTIYSAGGRSVATAATNSHAAAILWNPHSTKRIWLLGFEFCQASATSMIANLIRTTTQGTPGSTITPDIDNSWEQDEAPPSGAVLDLATYSVQPTLQGPQQYRIRITNAVGFGGMWSPPGGLCIPPGTGFGMCTAENSAIGATDFTVIWEERN